MPLRRLILEKAPLFLLAAVFAAVTLQSREASGALVSLDTISFSARLLNALTGYGWYLGSTFCPLWLAILYPHPRDNGSLLLALGGAALLLFITLFCWRQARRRPWLIVGWLWFVGTLLPVIGFAQGGKQAWADRFSYWPHIGLFVALVWELREIVECWRLSTLIPRLAAAFVLGWLTFLTWGQIGTWRDTPTLWHQALRVTRDNDQAHERLALYYRTQGKHQLNAFHITQAARIQRQRLPVFSPPPGFRPYAPAGANAGITLSHAQLDRPAPRSLSCSERRRLAAWPKWCWSKSAKHILAALRRWTRLACGSRTANWPPWSAPPAAAKPRSFD